MSKVAHYLQEHLFGEVTVSPEVRRHFAHDASILQLPPAVVVYPRNESDIRKTARFSWQLAQRGRIMPITARGGGSNTSGAALSSGILLVFTAHMNKILALDSKKELLTVEPGATFDKVEQTLYTHGLFLPPYPASQAFATIGGGIASNAIGEKSVKYGPLGQYVESLRLVLANGEVIETGPLSRRELNKKLGLSTLEGSIYRVLDTLLEDNAEVIDKEKSRIKSLRNASGYNLFDIKKKGSFNLTPLIVGSQGTLGIVTEATLSVVPHNPITRMAVVSLADLNDLPDVLPKVLELKPSILDMMNRAAIGQVLKLNPNQLTSVMDNLNAAIHLFVEFDDQKDSDQKKALKKLRKIVEKAGGSYALAETPEELERVWKIRQSVTTILTQSRGKSRAVPVAEDICVPVANLVEFLHKAAETYGLNELEAAAWGYAGDGVVRMQPVLNLGELGDRQKLFRISDSIYKAVTEMGGSLTAAAGDGRVRAPYLANLYSPEYHRLIGEVKKIFDPYGTLNPGVKTASFEDVKSLIRSDYNLAHHHQHLARS